MAIAHRKWRAAALLFIAVLVGTLFLGQDTNASALAGPMHADRAGPGLEGFFTLDPGEVVAMDVTGTLDGDAPAIVTRVRLIPLPGTVTPTLLHAALLTGLGNGFVHGWPKPDSNLQHRPLIGIPVPPMKHLRILVGWQAGYVEHPTQYGAAGIQVDYTVDGRPHTARIYGGMYACVKYTCDSDLHDTELNQKLEQVAGNH